MLMIIAFHLLVHGAGVGGKGNYVLSDSLDTLYVLLKSFLVLAVNCFVFISGYYRIRFKISTVLSLFLQATFYSVLLVIALENVPLQQLGFIKLVETLFPVFSGTWWFITAYFGLYLISPVLNKALDIFSKKQFFFVVVSFTILNCICGLFFDPSPMGANRGFSLISFIHIYIIAQYIRKYVRVSKFTKWAPAILIGSCLLIFFSAIISIKLLNQKGVSLIFAYNNPLVLIAAISFFFVFMRIQIRSWLINSISPFVLGVYLFHDHPLMREYLIDYLYGLSLNTSIPMHFLYLVLFTFLIFAAGFGVDKLRAYLLSPPVNYLMHKWKLVRLEHVFSVIPNRPAASGLPSGTQK